MIDKKYSVFISSTFEDLKEQRAAVLNVVLQNGHFPLGMELWGAADEQQWQIIQRQIDVADYYVVIIAHRYGSQHKGVSWTEMEYNYAVEKGVPVLGFILDKAVKWEPANIEKGAEAKKLDKFRTKVRKKPVATWQDTEDLKTKVVLALNRQIQSTSRIGWIRASEAVSSITANELARLSIENAQLREQIAQLEDVGLPVLGFDLLEAHVSITFEDHPQKDAPLYNVNASIVLDVTLKKGMPPGFNVVKTALSMQTGEKYIHLEPELKGLDGEVMDPILVDRPITLCCDGYSCDSKEDLALAREFASEGRIKLNFSLSPIGYSKQYSLSVWLPRNNKGKSLSWFATGASELLVKINSYGE